jgi:hypothetical protein
MSTTPRLMRDKLSNELIMANYSHEHSQNPKTAPNAHLLHDLAEAIVLGYPVIVMIGEVPGDERKTEVLRSLHFEGLDHQKQNAFVESAIVELKNFV